MLAAGLARMDPEEAAKEAPCSANPQREGLEDWRLVRIWRKQYTRIYKTLYNISQAHTHIYIYNIHIYKYTSINIICPVYVQKDSAAPLASPSDWFFLLCTGWRDLRAKVVNSSCKK